MDYTNPATFSNYQVVRPGQPEIIRQRLYDYLLYPTAGQAQLTFFANPVGQGVTSAPGAVVGSAKSLADTNMTAAGQLSKGVSYLAESIEVVFEPGTSAAASTFAVFNPSVFAAVSAAAVMDMIADVNVFRTSGWLELYILSKTYLVEAPLGAFPSKTHLELSAAVASNSATTAEVAAATAYCAGRPYYLDPPITLDSNTNFNVFMKWPGAVATPSGFNARVGVVFDGVQKRLSQ